MIRGVISSPSLSSTAMQPRMLSQLGRDEKCWDVLEYLSISMKGTPCPALYGEHHGAAWGGKGRVGLQDCSSVSPGMLETAAKSSLCSHKGFGNLLRELVDSKGVWSYPGGFASLGSDETNARTEEWPWKRVPTPHLLPCPFDAFRTWMSPPGRQEGEFLRKSWNHSV